MKRTYLDTSVLIQAVQGMDGDKTVALLEDPEREFVAATFLKLELLPQPADAYPEKPATAERSPSARSFRSPTCRV